MGTVRLVHRPAESGFSIIELMIVAGILAIVVSVLTIGIRWAGESFALRSAASLVLSEVRRSQAAAVAEQVEYTVEFAVGTPGALSIFSNTPAAEPCPAAMTRASGDYCVRRIQGRDNWPPSVGMAAGGTPLPVCPSGSGPWSPSNRCVQFRTLGAPRDVGGYDEGIILLQNTAGTTWKLVVTAGTGRARLER